MIEISAARAHRKSIWVELVAPTEANGYLAVVPAAVAVPTPDIAACMLLGVPKRT